MPAAPRRPAPDAPPSALRFYALMLWTLLTRRRIELDEDADEEPWCERFN